MAAIVDPRKQQSHVCLVISLDQLQMLYQLKNIIWMQMHIPQNLTNIQQATLLCMDKTMATLISRMRSIINYLHVIMNWRNRDRMCSSDLTKLVVGTTKLQLKLPWVTCHKYLHTTSLKIAFTLNVPHAFTNVQHLQ